MANEQNSCSKQHFLSRYSSQFGLTEKEKGRVGTPVTIRFSPWWNSSTWNKDERKRVELSSIGKEDNADTTMWKSRFPTSDDSWEIATKIGSEDDGWGDNHSTVPRIFEFSILPETTALAAIPEGMTIGPIL